MAAPSFGVRRETGCCRQLSWNSAAIRRKVLGMKLAWVLALVLLAPMGWAQIPAPKQASVFQWDWRHARYLDGTKTVGTSAKIGATDRALLLEALALQFDGYTDPRERAAKTGLKLVDLNGDGVPEAICQPNGFDICSATGNCPLWIFQKTAAGYKLVLQANSVQNFTIQSTRTNSFLDLVLGQHESATEQDLFVFRFQDGEYHLGSCYVADWSYLGKDGEYHDSEEPRLTPCPN